MDETLQPTKNRKKRLSRKEQKARKKQRRRHQQDGATPSQTKESPPPVSKSASIPRKEDEPLHVSMPISSASDMNQDSAPVASSDPIPLDQNDPSYIPTPVPSVSQLNHKHREGKTLGKWFPKGTVLKSPVYYPNSTKTSVNDDDAPKASLVLFYQYVSPPWTETTVQRLMGFLCRIAERRVLGGRIRVAPEGVNATLSSADFQSTTAATTIRHVCRDLQQFHAVFSNTDFKFLDNLSANRHFKDLKILPVQELVYYGLSPEEAPLEKGGVHLEPKEFHQMLESQNTVVVDVRNHYEAAIGRFDGQQQEHDGAEYVDPKMRKSTDLARWIQQPKTQDKLQNKQVLLYCTGGVRCERASAYLNQQMGDRLQGVYQLKGGIERYLQHFPDGGHWRGKNFVFDKREAISADNPDGDGGVIDKNEVKVDTHCCICQRPWDRYIGKKKCATCGVPVLMCDKCMSKKTSPSEQQLVRCPLCVEENVTVPADEVEWTDNGISVVAKDERKAAPSVLKWGGGHGHHKKDKRRLQRKPCRFGADCIRKDCFFAHPERDATTPKEEESRK